MNDDMLRIASGPDTDRYKHAMAGAFRLIQEGMDVEGLHPEAVGEISFVDRGGALSCIIEVDLQPGKSDQSFIEWFFTKCKEIEEVKSTH
jgi:hypothetical protein